MCLLGDYLFPLSPCRNQMQSAPLFRTMAAASVSSILLSAPDRNLPICGGQALSKIGHQLTACSILWLTQPGRIADGGTTMTGLRCVLAILPGRRSGYPRYMIIDCAQCRWAYRRFDSTRRKHVSARSNGINPNPGHSAAWQQSPLPTCEPSSNLSLHGHDPVASR